MILIKRKVLWSRWHLSWTPKGDRESISDKESGTEVGLSMGFGGEKTSIIKNNGSEVKGWPW